MAKKKTKDRPKHVSIYFDQLIYDLDFMPNEYAGIILKMIVWHSAGTDESKEHLVNMQKHIDTLPEKAWLTAMCKRLFSCIDEDLQSYADQCEKQRKRIQDYWDKKNSEENHGIPRNTTANNGIPTNTITDTDTDTDTDSPKGEGGNNNIPPRPREEIEKDFFEEAWKNKSWREAVCMNYKLTEKQASDMWETFKRHSGAFAKEHESVRDVQEHFNSWILNNRRYEKVSTRLQNHVRASGSCLALEHQNYKSTFDDV